MQCSIHKVEMVCPVCIGTAGGLKGGKARSAAKVAAARKNVRKAIKSHVLAARQRAEQKEPAPPKLDRKTIWNILDCQAYFEAHPTDGVCAKDLIAAAPPRKQASAHRYAAQRMFQLAQRGKIELVARGIYRLIA